MKGLIVKDLMVAGRQIRTALVIVLFYAVLFWRNASVLVGLMSLMSMMTVVSSFSYDEASRFLSYAAALPVARRTIVRAKYALGFGMLALGAGGSALLTLLVGVLAGGLAPLEALGAAAGCTLAMGFMLCLTLPLMFRLPVERARVFMTLAMIVPTLLIVTLTQVTGVPLAALERAPWPLLLAGMALLLAVCAAASYRIAVRLVQHRDL